MRPIDTLGIRGIEEARWKRNASCNPLKRAEKLLLGQQMLALRNCRP